MIQPFISFLIKNLFRKFPITPRYIVLKLLVWVSLKPTGNGDRQTIFVDCLLCGGSPLPKFPGPHPSNQTPYWLHFRRNVRYLGMTRGSSRIRKIYCRIQQLRGRNRFYKTVGTWPSNHFSLAVSSSKNNLASPFKRFLFENAQDW